MGWILTAVSLFSLTVPSESSIRVENKGQKFWDMDGHLFTHPYRDGPEGGYILYELRNKKGITIWYGREVYDEVCLTGLCKEVRIWIFWDCLGNYLGFDLFEDQPLTKTDHEVFSSDDYNRLNRILSDSTSIFMKLDYKDLVDEEEMREEVGVDGFSGATTPSLQNYAVEKAIYTCYTLWHAVYGISRKKIAGLNRKRADKDYILALFKQKEICYKLLAIELANMSDESTIYLEKVLRLLSSNEYILSKSAFDFLETKLPSKSELQLQLVNEMRGFNPSLKTRLIWVLLDIPNLEDGVVLALLQQFEKGTIHASSLGIIYQMVVHDHLKNQKILKLLRQNMQSQNVYVQRITEKLLTQSLY